MNAILGKEMSDVRDKLREKYWSSLDVLIQSNEELIKLSDDVKRTLSPVQFARELATVRVICGRGMGNTTYIAKNASNDDCVICLNAHQMWNFSEKRDGIRHFDEPPEILFLGNLNPWKSHGRGYLINNPLQRYNKVWVDCASVIKEDITWEIYERFESRTNQFIFLG